MANAVPSRIGQQNLTGNVKANFLKVFAGEVLTAFAESNKFIERHMVRTIDSGHSAQFPASWKGGAQYHTPGTELVGTTVAHNERVIQIDDLLVADRFIAKIDEAMSHYDVRAEYSKDVGRALARTFDRNVAQVLLLAARAAATVTGASGGTQITAANARTNADTLISAVFDAAAALDEKDVPDEDRFVALRPSLYYLLVNSGSKLIDTDLNPERNGSVASGRVYRVAGMEIVKSNNVPQSNVTAGPEAYRGDFTNTAALVWHRSAGGTVKLLDVATEMQWDIRRQGTLLLAKYAIGHGILRPESAVEIKVA
jgi:hypothetical protein